MTNNMKFLTNILYSEDITKALEQVQSINSSEQLFILLDNYNWDNGFELPQAVLDNSACTKATALLAFDRADGYRFLFEGFGEYSSPVWKAFIRSLYKNLFEDKFPDGELGYLPELSKVQKFRLKKQEPDLPAIFLDGVEGEDVQVKNLNKKSKVDDDTCFFCQNRHY
ncbi:DUF4274 domain-containing protein [Streptococcus oricebi]|uniref:DUF4274 domain-containing protein n=1 Tax=Streptococcus oricebi TaxID=1547447 RepID=A0ABS5B5U1_9STRE|nr:DUF4274 domain-containing protein [Streptococcus oricebi]MBP2623846.1 DUF4274 domain-containing protein [Streptococcus oricebi]